MAQVRLCLQFHWNIANYEHRLTIWTYETVLRNECNYTGAQPYWDYTLDTPENSGHFETSPLFDPVYGFGSAQSVAYAAPVKAAPPPKPAPPPKLNGTAPRPAGPPPVGSMDWMVTGACVTDGPFAKYQINLGPGNNSQRANPRCLKRNVNGAAAERGASKKNMNALMARTTFERFTTLDGNPDFPITSFAQFTPGVHSIGHMGIGGEMTNPWTSTNDPLFWMHHTELDRLWANWQGSNATRLNDLAAPVGMSFRAAMDNAAPRTNKDSMVWMGQFPPSLPIGKVADTLNRDGQGVLCYRYEG
jgi:tyrosinase